MLDNIKTVQDLINLNEQQPEVQSEESSVEELVRKHFDEIIELEPAVGISLCHKLLCALHEFHNQGVGMYIDKNNADIAAQWAFDAAKIEVAKNAIRDISL
jgi:hypothetical protein